MMVNLIVMIAVVNILMLSDMTACLSMIMVSVITVTADCVYLF